MQNSILKAGGQAGTAPLRRIGGGSHVHPAAPIPRSAPAAWHCQRHRSALLACRAAAASGDVGSAGAKKPKRGGAGAASREGKPAQRAAGFDDEQDYGADGYGADDFSDEDDDDEGEESFLAPFMDSVVKVTCVHTEPNFSLPWQRKRQYASSSTAFAIARGFGSGGGSSGGGGGGGKAANGKRGGKARAGGSGSGEGSSGGGEGGQGGGGWLLTNAHSVSYHTQVKVKRRGDDRKFLARVLSVGVDCDVALLTVDDPEFWDGLRPLEFGSLPRLQDEVAVVGYPVGGESISITAGVVSRIEVTEYSHGSHDLLGIQIDAAINSGNSGGPVFNARGQCVGIAFQALSGSDVENVGYVIPTPIVHHFLADFARSGGFTGFPALGVQWQRMESDALRAAYGAAGALPARRRRAGVLVRRVNPTSHAAAVLRPDDVLLSFDGTDVACDGTVPFRTGERIAFSYLISQKFVGDEARLEVLREGEVLELTARLSKPAALVPPHLGNRPPSYFVVSGFVFVACSEPYLESEYGSDYVSDAPVKLLDRLYHGQPSAPGEEVVVLSQVLAADSALGYEDVANVQVLAVNGEKVLNLEHLARLVAASDGPFLRFDCEYAEALVLDRGAAFADTRAVLASHGVPAALSPDVAAALGGAAWPPAAEDGAGKEEEEASAAGATATVASSA